MRSMLIATAVERHGYRVFRVVDNKGRQLRIAVAKKESCKFPIFYDVTRTRFVENKNWIGILLSRDFSNEGILKFFNSLDGRVSKVVDVTDEYRKKSGD